MKMLYGAKKILSEEIANPGSQNVNLGYPKFELPAEASEVRVGENILNPANIRPGAIAWVANQDEIIRYSTALITALQEALDQDPVRHHNNPPSGLRIEEADYLAEVRSLVTELKRLNSILEASVSPSIDIAEKTVNRLAHHFDSFFGAYAKSLGHGTAALTIAVAIALLSKAGVGTDLIETIWRHLEPK